MHNIIGPNLLAKKTKKTLDAASRNLTLPMNMEHLMSAASKKYKCLLHGL
jgi:hypothetical protein